MGGSRTQILLLIETNFENAVSHASSSGRFSTLPRRYALLPSRTKSHVFRKILAKNGIEVLQSGHINNHQKMELEMVEVFVDSRRKGQRKRPHLYFDCMNFNSLQQLLSETTEVCFSRESSTAVRYVLDEEENLQVIEKMLTTGAEITVWHSNGGTLLHFAAGSSHFYEKLMKLALKYGANINARRRDDRMTPIHLAVEKSCLGGVRLLLENGALINPKMKDGSTPLHVAARANHLEIARLLLNNGANANALMKNGSTPRHEAAKAGLSEMVELLSERGANADTKNTYFSTPLYVVVEASSFKLVRRLVQSGADVNVEREDCATALHIAVQLDGKGDSIAAYLVRNGADVNALDNIGATPLYYCVKKFTLMQFLVEHGADINVETNSGITVLLKAVMKGMLTTCEYLLDLNPNFRVKGNRTAFKVALVCDGPQYRDIADRMIQQGFSVDAKDANEPVFLFKAVFKNQPGIVEQLLILGASVNQHYEFRERKVTPLHLAVQGNHKDIVRLLLDHGADVAVKCDPNNCNSTPVSYAAKYASLNILKMLVAKNVEVLEEPCLLHSAVENADSKVIQFLLEENLNLNVKNDKGETPMSIAVNSGNINAINTMVRFGAQVALTDIKSKEWVEEEDFILLKAFLDYSFEYLILPAADVVLELFGPRFRWRSYYGDKCVEEFLRHLIKMEMANKLACARDVMPSLFYEELKLDYFKKQCEFETEAMALEKVGHTDVTFYDVLGKNQTQIAGLARNQNFVDMFEMCDVKKKFPIYGSILDNKFCFGSLRRNLLRSGIKVLSNFSRLFLALPDDLKEIIIDYLSNQDLFILQKGLPKE